MTEDDELEKVLKELLHNSNRIDASDITITVDKMEVTLSGTVKTQSDRDYAIAIIKLVQGVGAVHPELVVRRNEELSSHQG